MNAIVKQEQNNLPSLQMSEAELIEVLSSSLYPGASQPSIRMALGYCKAAGLDPMQKPIHIVPVFDSKSGGMRDVIMPGIGLYRTQAARNGCAGITEPDFGPDVTEKIGGVEITYPAWCRVTVKRKIASGDVVEFTAKEFWKENYSIKGGKEKSIAPNAMWTKRPYGQLAKCAEAQALRKAFPEIGSEPTAEEMAGKPLHDYDVDNSTGEITPTKAPVVEKEFWPEKEFNAQLDRWGKAIIAGLKTVDEIVALAKSKGHLTKDQEDKIRNPVAAKPQAEGVTDVQPKMTAAEQASHDEFLSQMNGSAE